VKGELSVTLIETDADGYKLTSNSEAKLASGPATSLDVQEDRGHVVVAGEDGTYSIWDASSGKVLVGPVQASESALNTAKWISPDSFVVASHSSEYQVWDRRTSNEVPVKVLKEQANSSGNIDRRVWSLDINPARPWLLLSSISGPSNDLSPTIAFHDLRSSIQPVLANASLHQGHIWQAQFHKAEPDYVLSASDDGRLIIWDTVTAFESTTSIKPSSIASQLQKKQNYRTLRNDGLSINCFAVDTHHNLVISASDAESVAFNLELI
jgi:WD40 repeat protein